jgi:SIR2-like domain/TIR domain
MTPKIPRSLEEALRDGRVIPFVGAGVSMAVERVGGGRIFPSWKQLLLDGAARLEREGKKADVVHALLEDDEPDYLPAAKRLRDKLGPLWGAFFKDAIDVSRAEVAEGSLALARAVWRLGSRLVITTNYDQILRWACPEEWRDDLEIWNINAPAEEAEYLRRGEVRAPTVWHLHGHIDHAAGLILTPDGYTSLHPAAGETEPRHQAALEMLRHLLASRSFLFAGFSLDDEHFGVELRRMLDTFVGFGGPHYALVHQRDVEKLRRLESSVEMIVFKDFGEPLLELMGELSRHVNPARDLGPVDIYLAEVADSLRPLRQRVHDDLTREGVRVAWDVPPPFDAEGHRQQVTAVLKRARLSVHLLDGYAGRKVDGKPETTYPQEQVRLARDHAQSQLIWVPRPLAEVDESQQTLLTELRSGDRGSSRYRFVEGMAPSELVHDILARLGQDRPWPEEARAMVSPTTVAPTPPAHPGTSEVEFDLFICHASEDKEAFVEPLARRLKEQNLRVWYDSFRLKWGDRLRPSIDKGLSRSRFGIVVLSPSFCRKEWPQRELEGLLALERGGRKVILPLWHGVDHEDVARFSPILADRIALTSSLPLERIVDEILKIVHE